MGSLLFVTNSYSRDVLKALGLLGNSIRAARVERRISMAELAVRIGISRQSLHRIERGEPGSSIGSVFEAAAIVGVPLFEVEPGSLAAELAPMVEEPGLPPMMLQREVAIDDRSLDLVSQ